LGELAARFWGGFDARHGLDGGAASRVPCRPGSAFAGPCVKGGFYIMIWRRTVSLAVLTTMIGLSTGCGHSEEEWQAKLKESQELQNQLNAEKAAHQKSDADLQSAQSQIDQLKGQLKKLGLDLSNLNADYSEQKDALDKLRKDKEQLEQIRKRFELLKAKLDSLTRLGLTVSVRKNRMTIQLPGDVLFDSGRVDLKKDGKDILLKVADVIRNDKDLLSRSFQVAGHTDNTPLAGGPFRDNWGLSVMRAREVLTFLVAPVGDKKGPGGGGLPPDHWSAAGYGETDPVASNDKAENKQKNRRVELVVVPNVEEMLDLKSLTK
jgi:chemotaxis protein MotB